jgi:formyl-CoA transferase
MAAQEGGGVRPLEGITVVELAAWIAVPATTALMADMGARVIKVEPPGGDIQRGYMGPNHSAAIPKNLDFLLVDRGKRSVTIDLEKPGAPDLLRRLIRGADVFATNMLPARRERFGLTYEELARDNPRLIGASFTAYGMSGPDRNRGSWDWGAFWARSGIMGSLGDPETTPILSRGGQGDLSSSLSLLAAVMSALYTRERTGRGMHVETTLQSTAMWTVASDYAAALYSGKEPVRVTRASRMNPMANYFRCGDGRWLMLTNSVPFPNAWPAFCRMVGRDDWLAHYHTLDELRADGALLTPQVEAIFAEHDLAYWTAALDASGLLWAPVATMQEVIHDPQVEAMGWFAPLEDELLGPFRTVNTPFKIHGADVGARAPAPDAGVDTMTILEDVGLDEEQIAELAIAGVLG